MGYPDPDVLWRLDMFSTRRACDCGAFPPGDIANRGDENRKDFGPVLFTGRAVRRSVKTSIGSASIRSGNSGEAGTKLVDDATSATEAYRDVARA
ncbi:hypothetical protein NKI12_28170 [Mesorhizobium australicum]|uniref:Uncharacterized protein n=1 Tax=Mesorhizobium australicum TaxID=536018 RepID=A0ACC6T6T1_9HYPH